VGKQENGGWASSGEHLDADPATLRGYGQNIAKLRWDFQTDITEAGMNLRGTSKDSSLSTGFYEPGQTCNDLVDSNGQEFTEALNCFLTSLTAIPAGALTMADLFDGVVAHGKAMINAQGDAMAWAFAMPGATRPAGVPSYIKGTIQGEMKKAAAAGGSGKFEDKWLEGGLYSGASVSVYSTAGGGKRYMVRTPGGGYVEWGENAKGERTYQTTYNGDGPVVTKVYSEGEVTSTVKRYQPTDTPLPVVFPEEGVVSVVDEQQKVETYDKDGKLTTTTEHVVVTKYSDSTETHTYSTEKDGKSTTTGTVGRQPAAVTPDTWSELAKKQSQEMVAKTKEL
jgi:hypothetical protein